MFFDYFFFNYERQTSQSDEDGSQTLGRQPAKYRLIVCILFAGRRENQISGRRELVIRSLRNYARSRDRTHTRLRVRTCAFTKHNIIYLQVRTRELNAVAVTTPIQTEPILIVVSRTTPDLITASGRLIFPLRFLLVRKTYILDHVHRDNGVTSRARQVSTVAHYGSRRVSV